MNTLLLRVRGAPGFIDPRNMVILDQTETNNVKPSLTLDFP